MFNNLILYYHTLRHLKLIQIVYRTVYFIRKKTTKKKRLSDKRTPEYRFLQLTAGIPSKPSYRQETFIFIGVSHKFDNGIDWDFPHHGKLWTYNLNYFDFLNQENFSREEGIAMMHDFIGNLTTLSVGLEPYPTSVRGINWIKFISKHEIRDQKIVDSLYSQYDRLMKNIEYHVLGNHLLENAFSLFYAGCFFNETRFAAKAKKILITELDEQILSDGAHFELSPMYHQIILHRTLDCLNVQQSVAGSDRKLTETFKSKAAEMIGWLNKATWSDGSIPSVNDAAAGIAPSTEELNQYAGLLQLNLAGFRNTVLSDSGYRKFRNGNYEIFIDAGNIGPDYIPGHAHSDTFSFEMFIGKKPFIVDTGVSTYENNQRRYLERSTKSHNTVMFNNLEQTEIWASHRVGRRAKVKILNDTGTELSAQHDGYLPYGVFHIFSLLSRN
ncbi:MAG: alginate lyase family protein [Bacteroidetes bacterium]|nr:alginate lyase family protein [Bacteroidota bacterium]